MKLVIKRDNIPIAKSEFEGGWDSSSEPTQTVATTTAPLRLNIANGAASNSSNGNGANGNSVNGGKMKLNIKTSKTSSYQGPTAADTRLYTPRTHVYMKPDVWICPKADVFVEEEMWLYNLEEAKIYKEVIRFVPGVERIFLEILANASDNANMSRRMGTDAGKIDILMNNSHISITNYGLPMPVEEHPDAPGKYVPEVSFGRLLTSRHYENERNESGTNGIGSKATNIFSKEFTCIVHDHVRHWKYTQTWRNNMREVSNYLLEPYNGKISSVQIVYKMDFTRFGYPEPDGQNGGYPIQLFHLFARHALDTSFNAKIPVTFNGLSFNTSNIRDYARMYFGDLVDTAVIHYQWPAGTEVIKKKKGYQVAKDPSILPDVELLALDTPDSGYHISFANCLMTKNGGIHVNAAIKAVADSTVKMINEKIITKLVGGKKGKEKEIDGKEKRANTITINDVKPHISVFLSVKVTDPQFDGQQKSKLEDAKPPPKINVPEECLKNISKWELIPCLYKVLEAKQWRNMKKGDGKAGGRTKKGVNANRAGKADKHKCTLYITEGDSGAAYVEILSTFVPGGMDYIGILAMKGKNLNVMNATFVDIGKNKEFNQLKKMLGLEEGLDYMDDHNFSTLRYGSLMIAADADVDGKHITSLILCYFHCRFPGLLARGFIKNYLTPIMGITIGNQVSKFYSEPSHVKWLKETQNANKLTKDNYKYYKGLASSEDADIQADFNNPRIVPFFYDIDAPEKISLVFKTGRENERKEWLANWQPLTDDYIWQQQPISWFLDNEMILHGLDNVARTIPKLMDGLKEGHRKIIYAMHLKWAIGSKSKKYTEMKVAQFAGFVAEKTSYHHGEMILGKTIVGMAQDFVGSNNIAYLAKKGQYGTRFKSGKNAGQTRYIFTLPMPIVSAIYNKKDKNILKHMVEEGGEIEPEQFLPVLPMLLVNGATGIGTGWSSYTPPHNPLDIIKCLKMLLNGVPPSELPRLMPWFRGFLGKIEIINRKNKTKTIIKADGDDIITKDDKLDEKDIINEETGNTGEEDDEDEPEEFQDEDKEERAPGEPSVKKQLYSMKITGNFETKPNGDIIITELPIGRSPFNYLKWLEKLKEEKKIKDFRNLCGKDVVYFEIQGFQPQPTHKNLLLEKTKGLSNMVVLDENDKPIKLNDANEILVKWYNLRLPFYGDRKKYMDGKITEDIRKLKNKLKFVTAVFEKQIKVTRVSVASIHAKMNELGIDHDAYNGNLRCVATDGRAEIEEQIRNKEKEQEELAKISIQQMMLTDLDEFEKVYRREYQIKNKVIKLNTRGKTNANTNNKLMITNGNDNSTMSTPKFPTSANGTGKLGKSLNRPLLNVQQK
jgi:DNA topoisomerase-2